MKALLSFFLVAVAVFGLSAPFLMVERWLGFVVFLIGTMAFFFLRKRMKLLDRPLAYVLGFVAALVCLVPASFFAQILEKGFDDGPFLGRPFQGDFFGLVPSDSAKYRSGHLVIYNRDEHEAPVLAYRTRKQTPWACEMYVSMSPASDTSALWKMTAPSVAHGLLRDRLDFIGQWTYGAEHGYAYIWKFGSLQRFYLSW